MPIRYSMFKRIGPAAAVCLLASSLALAKPQTPSNENGGQSGVRYLTYDETRDTIAKYADSGMPGSKIASRGDWESWIREQDRDIRSRIDRGVEDSISNLALFGTAFSRMPRFEDSEAAEDRKTKSLTAKAISRVADLASAIENNSPDERVAFVRQYLKRKRIAAAQRRAYLQANLLRYLNEQRRYRAKLEEAAKSGDKSTVTAARGTLYATRGLSVDTSLLPNYAIEDTLRVMLGKGAIKTGEIKRIAVIGPGLDFADKRDGYDFYPLQTIQPFAVMEAVERLGLGKREELQVMTLDLNAAVNSHVARVSEGGKSGQRYQVQLPRDIDAPWTTQAVNYWENFGGVIGSPAKPLAVPQQLPSVRLRALAITSDRAARLKPVDLNIVAQTTDFAEGEGFDLVIATNILVYYDHFQQALAMTNIARMMNPGGIFVCNTALPSAHDERLKYLGGRSVAYAQDGSYGDDIVVYRMQP